jgi:hypothetical protein
LIAFYSPRTSYPDGEPLHRFTAIARVLDDEAFQVEMCPDFRPWRRLVEPIASVEAPIAPLLESLDFITDKRRWGFVFRRGTFEIGEGDLARIAQAMHADVTCT